MDFNKEARHRIHHVAAPAALSYCGQMQVTIRKLEERDMAAIVARDGGPAWHGGMEKWQRYWAEHRENKRVVMVAESGSGIIGYGSLKWASQYPPFREAGIPEIQDMVVAQECRRLGAGTRLIQALENCAKAGNCTRIGIGFGLYADYGIAQRLYIRLGYIPDGRGVTYKTTAVRPGATVPVDDDLVLWLLKPLV